MMEYLPRAEPVNLNAMAWSRCETWNHQIEEARQRLDDGESQPEVGRLFGVSHQTIGRL